MSLFPRKQNSRKPRKVIRIYTEGEKTEPNYFGAIRDELRLNEIDIKVYGCGDHTLSLVEVVIERKKNEGGQDGFETEWWVVIDKDDHEKFNEAIEVAQANEIKVAYSNECFELWFILHFEFLQTSIGRDNFSAKLTKLLGRTYEKNSPDLYSLLKSRENTAIKNAKNLEKMHNEQGVHSFEKRDPSTLVYALVERLRKIKATRFS